MGRTISSVTLAIAVAATLLGAATVTVDPATQYQTVEGFGGFGPAKVWWDGAPYYTQDWVNQVVNDLGATMIRTTVSASFEYTNDNSDPNVMNRAACNISSRVPNDAETHLGAHFPFYRAMKAAYENNGEVFRLIASVWTPPAWMKTNNDIRNGGNLRTDMYAEYAERCLEYCRVLRDSAGVELYGFSIQNEPAFVEPYESCVYTAQTYRDVVKVVGPRVHAEFPDVKFFGAEHMLASWGVFEGVLNQDAAAREQMGAYAVHGYTDGVTPQPSSTAANLWNRAWNNTRTTGKGLWMTETSGYSADWGGAFQNAESIYAGLKYGHIAAWVLWYTCDNMYSGNSPDKRYYIHKQFARYVRPGAKGIGCTSDDSLVLAVAFHHTGDAELSMVLLNAASSQKTVSVAGPNVPAQLAAWRSSSSENCVSLGSQSSSSFTLPARSITTLVASDYATSVQPRFASSPGQRKATTAMRGAVAAGGLYGVDGRRAGGGGAVPAGVYVRAGAMVVRR